MKTATVFNEGAFFQTWVQVIQLSLFVDKFSQSCIAGHKRRIKLKIVIRKFCGSHIEDGKLVMTSLAPTKSARIPDICTKICSINTGSVMQSYPSCMRVVFCYSKQSKIIRNKPKFVIKWDEKCLSYEYEIVLICSQTGNSVHWTAFYPWFC